ncbi:MAG TPA: universal stress protein [Polyangiaceae bacterium]|nr:universal stress protein [Polyangiaceae bacterium]
MSGPLQRILVAVDLSSCSRAVLEFACTLARPMGSTLEVLFVRPPAQVDAAEELHRFVHPIVKDAGLTVIERVEAGDARERIVAIAAEEKFDLVAVGTHGRTGRPRSLAGSVAESVVRTATCPVMTVRER